MSPTPAETPDPLAPALKHHKAGRHDQAVSLLRRLIARGDAPTNATILLAQVLHSQQKHAAAIFELERLIRARPAELEPRLALVTALTGVAGQDRALLVLEEATRLHPNSAEAWTAMGVIGVQLGRLSESEGWLRRALELEPHHPGAVVWLAQALSGMLRTKEAVELLRAELKALPGRPGLQQTLAFLLQYLDDVTPEEVFREQRLAGLLVARSAGGLPPQIRVQPDPERRITIGYISPDFRSHPCAYFIEPLLEAHDRSRVRTIAYSCTTNRDDTTRRLRGLVDEWREVSTLNSGALAELIVQDRIDVAVDLAGHSAAGRLPSLALRPAPVTVTYLGYPNTTGMPGMDYRIVDWRTDPAGAESLATETLIRLEGCFLCYRPEQDAPPVAPPPHEKNGHVTFGSFNIAEKISPSAARAWSEALRAVRGSRLVLKGSKPADGGARARLVAMFAGCGIETERIEILPRAPSVREHLSQYARVDIALDAFPYNGTTTTCESLWMGVPVVALAGARHAGRVGVSLLSAVGLPDLVAGKVEDFPGVASTLAADPARLSWLRAGLREQVAGSELCDSSGFGARFQSALRDAWRKKCRSPSGAAP